MESTVVITIIFLRYGRIMNLNYAIPPAPSIEAASSISFGMVLRPARNIVMKKGKANHEVTNMMNH